MRRRRRKTNCSDKSLIDRAHWPVQVIPPVRGVEPNAAVFPTWYEKAVCTQLCPRPQELRDYGTQPRANAYLCRLSLRGEVAE